MFNEVIVTGMRRVCQLAIRLAAVLGLTAVLLAPAASAADDSQKSRLVAELLAMVDVEQTAKAYMSEYAKAMLETWKVTLHDPDAETLAALDEELTHHLVRDYIMMEPVVAELYRNTFTVEELQAMIDFYKSPVGMSILEKGRSLDESFAKVIYPESLKNAERHWYESVDRLRKEGRKL